MPRNGNQLTVMIEMKDKEGRVVGRKEVATYHGLLAKAHDEGLRRIDTEIVQAPSKDNGETAIVRAKVTTNKGTFTGIGDASPGNVNRRIASHLLRMAETRAKARALRDAVNIGTVALEELGELLDDESPHEDAAQPNGNGAPRAAAAPLTEAPPADRKPLPFPSHGDNAPMTDSQRRFLFRLASQKGVKPDEAKAWLEQHQVPIRGISDHTVSQSIYFADPDGNEIEVYVDAALAIWRDNPQAVAGARPLTL